MLIRKVDRQYWTSKK